MHVIARLFASRTEHARLFSGKFLAVLPLLAKIWLGLGGAAVMLRAFRAPDAVALWYCAALGVTVMMPAVALLAILNFYPVGGLANQPAFRLSRLGRWRQLDAIDCARFENYGTGGLLTMLIIGLLINIPVRTLEFLAAMPTPHAHAPSWYFGLHNVMLIDLAIFGICYAVLAGLAVRSVPLFPRLLVMVWLLDLLVQVAIGGVMRDMSQLPTAVQAGLAILLSGNMQKVGIGMAIWMPYLAMSRRVNLTYRHRVASISTRNVSPLPNRMHQTRF